MDAISEVQRQGSVKRDRLRWCRLTNGAFSPRQIVNAIMVALFLAGIGTPLLIGVVFFKSRRPPVQENRTLAELPPMPHSWAELAAAPKQIDVFARDHFGGRLAMVRAATEIRFHLFHETPLPTVLGDGDRLFLGSHTSEPYQLIWSICGVHVTDRQISESAAAISHLLHDASRLATRSYFAVIPTAPALYTEQLPAWLRRQCAGAKTAERILDKLKDDQFAAVRTIYPFATLMAATKSGEVIPRYNFHWEAFGARAAARQIAESYFHLQRAIELPIVPSRQASDLSRFLPGLSLVQTELVSGESPADFQRCQARPECLPELGPSISLVGDYTRVSSSRPAPRKLLLLSDSYGASIAPWFGEYFSEVWHLSTNAMERLSAAQIAELRHTIFDKFAPDFVLFLYHDGAAIGGAERTDRILMSQPELAPDNPK